MSRSEEIARAVRISKLLDHMRSWAEMAEEEGYVGLSGVLETRISFLSSQYVIAKEFKWNSEIISDVEALYDDMYGIVVLMLEQEGESE
jgi:hypothetical protein